MGGMGNMSGGVGSGMGNMGGGSGNMSSGLLELKNNEFAHRFLNQLSKNKLTNKMDNGLIYSPFSIFYLMQLVYMGASRETRQELGQILGHNVGNEQSESSIIKEMIQLSRQMVNSGTFQIANGFFFEKSFDCVIRNNFRRLMNRLGRLESCNFVSNSTNEVAKINAWIKQNTKGLIPELLSPTDVDAMTKLILVNTIYFKASWAHKFKKSSTLEQKFQNLNGQHKTIPLMNMKEKIGFFQDQNVKILSMKYVGENFAMDFFLPKNLGQPAMKKLIEKNYMKYDLDVCLYTDEKVDIFIPKFTQRCRNNLNSIFQVSGVQKMFDTNNAEFENLVTSPVGSDLHLYVSDIIHDAVVIVDEEGTEAAAVTAVIAKNFCMSEEKETRIFRADHSFLYQIRYLPQNLVLFQGIFDGKSNA